MFSRFFLDRAIFLVVICNVVVMVKKSFDLVKVLVVVMSCLPAFLVGIFVAIALEKFTCGLFIRASVDISDAGEGVCPVFSFCLHVCR